jgi:hypothetical protein
LPPKTDKGALADLQLIITAMGAGAPAALKLKASLLGLKIAFDEMGAEVRGVRPDLDAFKDTADKVIHATDLADRLGAVASALGSLSTPIERADAKTAALNVTQAAGKLTAEQYARAQQAIKLDTANEQLQKRLGILGNLAPVEDQQLALQRQINDANLNGANLTAEQTRRIMERGRVQAEAAVPENQLRMEREMLGLTQEEAQIRQKLIGFGIDFNSTLGQTLASQMRVTEELKQLKDITTDVAQGFSMDFKNALKDGENGWNAFKKAGLSTLDRLGDKLRNLALDRLISSLFGNLMPSIGGIGSTGGSLPIGQTTLVNTAHTGGVVGGRTGGSRFIHPAYFEQAPRMHSGGIVGLRPNERPIIAEVGEVVTPKGGMRGGGVSISIGSPQIVVQGDASEKTLGLIRQEMAEHDRALPGKIVKTIQEAKSRRVIR